MAIQQKQNWQLQRPAHIPLARWQSMSTPQQMRAMEEYSQETSGWSHLGQGFSKLGSDILQADKAARQALGAPSREEMGQRYRRRRQNPNYPTDSDIEPNRQWGGPFKRWAYQTGGQASQDYRKLSTSDQFDVLRARNPQMDQGQGQTEYVPPGPRTGRGPPQGYPEDMSGEQLAQAQRQAAQNRPAPQGRPATDKSYGGPDPSETNMVVEIGNGKGFGTPPQIQQARGAGRSPREDIHAAALQHFRASVNPDMDDRHSATEYARAYRQAQESGAPLVAQGEAGYRENAEYDGDMGEEGRRYWRHGLHVGTRDRQFLDGQGTQQFLEAINRQQQMANAQDWRQMQARQEMGLQMQRRKEAMRRRQLARQERILKEAAEERRESAREMIRRMNEAEREAQKRRQQEREQIRRDLMNTFRQARESYQSGIRGVQGQFARNRRQGLGAYDLGQSANNPDWSKLGQ